MIDPNVDVPSNDNGTSDPTVSTAQQTSSGPNTASTREQSLLSPRLLPLTMVGAADQWYKCVLCKSTFPPPESLRRHFLKCSMRKNSSPPALPPKPLGLIARALQMGNRLLRKYIFGFRAKRVLQIKTGALTEDEEIKRRHAFEIRRKQMDAGEACVSWVCSQSL